jgi:RimK family alpha-L-glutamate ligase
MQIIILATKTGWHTDQLSQAIRSRGLEPVILPWEANLARIGEKSGVSNGDRRIGEARALLPRIIPNGSLEQIIFRVDLLHRLEAEGLRVMNSARAIERSVDKAWTSALLQQAGLRTPETIVCERIEDAFAAWREMGDVVVKPLFGSMGLGMTRVSDEDMAFRVFRAIEMTRGVFYLQRFVEHDGKDFRAFVVGGRVVGAIERSASGWRTNFSRGGKVQPATLDSAWVEMAVSAARAVGAEYAGVDLLPGRDGTVHVLEVNGIPGWQGLHQATGLDVAGLIVDQLLSGAGSGA